MRAKKKLYLYVILQQCAIPFTRVTFDKFISWFVLEVFEMSNWWGKNCRKIAIKPIFLLIFFLPQMKIKSSFVYKMFESFEAVFMSVFMSKT